MSQSSLVKKCVSSVIINNSIYHMIILNMMYIMYNMIYYRPHFMVPAQKLFVTIAISFMKRL